MATPSKIPHLVTLQDLSDDELQEILTLSVGLKTVGGGPSLAGKSAGMLFFRPSLRTRTSFEAAMHQLGGHSVNMNAATDFWELEARPEVVMDGRAPEHIKDAAAVLSRYLNVLAVRPALEGQSWAVDRNDESIRSWAAYSQVPMINMESALWHPLQALADLMTMRESLGELTGKKLVISWVHSTKSSSAAVVHSLALAALRQGMRVHIAHPPRYELDEHVMAMAQNVAASHETTVETTLEQKEALEGAHVVYARSWQSLEDYGNPTLSASHRSKTTSWALSEDLLTRSDGAKVMHAMPVRRNVEISDEVLDGPRSLLYDQAENRLHSQKALLVKLLQP